MQLIKRDWRSQAQRLAARCLLGGVCLALVTYVCFRLGLTPSTAAFAYLILVVLLALIGTFIESVLLSIVAVGCLRYFFAPPIFSFQVNDPNDALAINAFFTTSIIVAGLTAKVRRLAASARASEKALVNTIPALVWSALPDGSRDFYSQRWLEFTGLSPEEARSKGWAAALHPEDQAAVVAKWRSAVATGEPFEVEARGRSAGGDYRWFLIRAEPLRNDKGTIVKWYGSNTDIEDRKCATEMLRESEAQWREVFEHNPVMYFMVDATGTVLSVNGFGATQLGYTVPELVGQSVLNVFFQEDREFVLKNVAVCLETLGQPQSWEVRKVRKNGTVLWVRENAKAVRRSNSQVIVLVACEDITERKLTEDALRQSQLYLAEAQKIARTGYFRWGITTGEIFWSDEVYRIYGYEPDEKPAIELAMQRTHPEDLVRTQQHLEKLMQEERDWEYEYRLLMPNGAVKYIRAVNRTSKDAFGNLEMVGSVIDVTATRQAEEELHQAQAQLMHVARVTTLGELTASIAHEVNQPLAGVVSSGNACVNWLASQPPNIEKAKQSVDRIIRNANRASEVVGRVRDLAKKAPLQKVRLDINHTIQETIVLTRREIEQNRVSLRTQLSSDLPLVLADRIQLQQVILNLIINAIEAMNTLSDGPRDLHVSTRRDDSNNVVLAVRDSGAGLDPRELENIFEAFYTTKRDGLGMGLAVSRSIIEGHGGRLWATPNEPRGAIFQLTLPTGRQEAS
jgi:PAS domain S-box-containing protein